MNELQTTKAPVNLPAHLASVAELAKGYIQESTSPATRRAYASDCRVFAAWCKSQSCQALPATSEVVAMFLADQAQAGANPSTLTRRVAAISYAHDSAGHESPTKSKLVAATLKGIRRAFGAGKKQKAPVTAERLTTMLANTPDTLIGVRDRAVLLLGFAGAFRRSELVALTVADLEDVAEGFRVHIRHSKTDQEGQGQTVAIYNGAKLRPVSAVKAWLEAARITEGPVFRSINKGGNVSKSALTDGSVAALVKQYATLAGLDAADFSGHSLRSGFLTSAAEAGADLFKMMEVSRHKRVDTVRGYVRSAELFKNHAGSSFL